VLNRTIKEAHTIDVAVPNSHSLHSFVTGKLQKCYILERRANKKMATANTLYNTNGATIHSGYYSKLITRKLETAYLHPALSLYTYIYIYIYIYSITEISNTKYMCEPYSEKHFNSTVNRMCMVSETGAVLRTG
jgi:hypothetical protein